ncbi:adenosylcobinamide-GDP ribazoletransferase [Massilia sp. W12]|uniref:adenosylcobinamide-GDP ribazoletransferase n=1 Tax=Massilia sp. W12 TaxID=3126507 RepID=UPI0030D24FD6
MSFLRWLALQVRLFFIALQFFTRMPTPAWVGFEPSWLQHSVRYFTAVGLLLGLILAALYGLLCAFFNPLLAVLLSGAAGLLLTGAFHEDGFADMCDGFGGAYTRERALEIMVDSRIGAFGAIGIFTLLACKIGALSQFQPLQGMGAILLAHPLSRLASCSLIWRMQYVKGEGKAKPLAQQMSHAEFACAALFVLLPLALLWQSGIFSAPQLLCALALVVLATLEMARRMLSKIGGYTGDCLGATQQVTEVCCYLGLLAHLPWCCE